MKISYECSDLIEELMMDINEFGNFELWAFSHEINGFRVYTDYDFTITREEQLSVLDEGEEYVPPISLRDGERKETMLALKLLEILEEQNSIF